MKLLREFQKELNRISVIAIKKPYYRSIGVERLNNPIEALQSKLNGGRYNFIGSFEALYLAPNPFTAIKESLKEFKENSKVFDFKFPPKVTITVEVEVEHIIDLQDGRVIRALGIEEHKLIKPWRYTQDVLGKEAYTQILGRLIYESAKFDGIRYPSAKVSKEYNLVIFPDRLKEISQISVYDPNQILKKIILRG